MKFLKSRDFIEAISKVKTDGKQVKIDLIPDKYGWYEELDKWGEWNGKYFSILGRVDLKNIRIEWTEDLNYLINQLEGKEINKLGPNEYNDGYEKVRRFDGFEYLGDDGGHDEPYYDDPRYPNGIKWFDDENFEREIQLSDKEVKEFEKLGDTLFLRLETLWNEVELENTEHIGVHQEEDGILKIIVTIDQDIFALVNEEIFDRCDDNGDWS
tara:strand:+ start:115 stop:750 length:636 start_codon:yes stop_codon:yes gene_type:complete